MSNDLLKELLAVKEQLCKLPQTGTAAYGMTNPSDDDRYCGKQEFDTIVAGLDACGVTWAFAKGYSGPRADAITFDLGGTRWNLFSLSPTECEKFKMCTAAFRAMYDLGGPVADKLEHDKKFRVMLFRVMRDAMGLVW